MPNWKTHLEIAKRLNKHIKYNEEEFNLFLLGNILPDINNCYIVKDISNSIHRDITHVGNFKSKTYFDFYNKYSNEILRNNSIFMGYLLHLFTDYKFNENFYGKKADYTKYNKEELRIKKQSDFRVFNNNFAEHFIENCNIDKAIKEVDKIEEVSLEIEDIIKVLNFLRVKEQYNEKMNFYTLSELNDLANEVVDEFLQFINDIYNNKKRL